RPLPCGERGSRGALIVSLLRRASGWIENLRTTVALCWCLLSSVVLPSPVYAQGVADFYRGKNVALAISFSPGGGYDLYARTLARHMGKYVPGNPAIVPQNMPGAGGLRVAQYFYAAAPPHRLTFPPFPPIPGIAPPLSP